MGEVFYIIFNLDKKSIKRLSEELGHKRDSIHRLAKDFKESLTKNLPDPILSGDIEIDEMYYSAGDKGLKKQSSSQRPQTKRQRNLGQRQATNLNHS